MTIRSLQAAEEWTAAARESEHFDAEAAIGAQIRELRKIKGFTLQHVAGEAGISVGYLNQIERNQSKLPIGVLKKNSDVLGVHMNWFFQPITNNPPQERDGVVRKAKPPRLDLTGP